MRCLSRRVSAVGLFTIRKAMIFLLGSKGADMNKRGGGFRKPPPDNFVFQKTPNRYTYFLIHASLSILSEEFFFPEGLSSPFAVKIHILTNSRKFRVSVLSEIQLHHGI